MDASVVSLKLFLTKINNIDISTGVHFLDQVHLSVHLHVKGPQQQLGHDLLIFLPHSHHLNLVLGLLSPGQVHHVGDFDLLVLLTGLVIKNKST